jgi:LPS sulfotransferase NodH
VLCSALWSTDLCGRPDEYLAPGTRREYQAIWGHTAIGDAYAEHVLGYATTPNGVFSMKVHAGELGFGRRGRFRARKAAAVLDPYLTAVEQSHFFVLCRRDKVRQAVSLYVAREARRYRRLEGDTAPAPAEVPFRASRIRALMRQIDRWEGDWGRYFAAAGIAPTRLWYEDDIQERYVDTAQAVLRTVGVEPSREIRFGTPYRKQSDAVSEALVQRFLGLSRGRS